MKNVEVKQNFNIIIPFGRFALPGTRNVLQPEEKLHGQLTHWLESNQCNATQEQVHQ
jgi:hypothetical protein